jgi:hypothetical protein
LKTELDLEWELDPELSSIGIEIENLF